MFIGWIRKNRLTADLQEFEAQKVIDKNLVLNSYEQNPTYSFGIYEGEKLLAIITAYDFNESVLINNFYALDGVNIDLKRRLVRLLLNNIDKDKTILILTNSEELDCFTKLGFKEYASFKQAIFSGGGVAFNFSNATAKSISSKNYQHSLKIYDYRAFKEDRFEYITTVIMKQSSLMLSNDFGYQHSYALNRSLVKISPWIMQSEALSDAEKFIRGVIYHRGLKKIIAFIPDIKEIVDLYKSYRFELVDGYQLLYLGYKPTIDLEMVYGL
ncbi:MAG TPA: hypothetical protein ENK88_06565 [Campylobacterales bacterium]|nr:hypothetical protein [Campylobacterales bacterium]HHC11056.1 hypothetical protein [Campylobacterales bacterium]HHD81146.1 hypothetical protein [Campylobacterales bacterium]